MANVKLGEKSIGNIVKIKLNGIVRNFLIVHQGKPSSIYDDSCDGTWLLMQDVYEKRQWNTSNSNSYANSVIHSYLNSTFLNLFESNIKNVIKQVKIPYYNDSDSSTGVLSGFNGLSAKIFLLSATETSFNFGNAMPKGEGSELAYFKNCADNSSDSKRIANFNESPIGWWLRSPRLDYSSDTLYVFSNGNWGSYACSDSIGVRPALILPPTLFVSDDGIVSINNAPIININSTNLGEKDIPFNFEYTVTDSNGDTITVTEKLDGIITDTHTNIASGSTLTFKKCSTVEGFRNILNGSHTIQIIASDGVESTIVNVVFTKTVTSASVTLANPLAVAGNITVAILQVNGDIPEDAKFKAEVTNNALDDSPVWQDVTIEVQKGQNIVFSNKIATNGAAFNFRINITRGPSGASGYIKIVSGAFQ